MEPFRTSRNRFETTNSRQLSSQPSQNLNFASQNILETSGDPEFLLMSNPVEFTELFSGHPSHLGYPQQNGFGFNQSLYSQNQYESISRTSTELIDYSNEKNSQNSFAAKNRSANQFRQKLQAKYGRQPDPKPGQIFASEDITRCPSNWDQSHTNNSASMSMRPFNNMYLGDASSVLTDKSLFKYPKANHEEKDRFQENSDDAINSFTKHQLNCNSSLDSTRDQTILNTTMRPKLQKPIVREEKPQEDPAEEVMNSISKNQLNCISLLNEVSSKVKKRIDYLVKDLQNPKVKIFECICTLDKQSIGSGKGNSKQAAKAEAATSGVHTLLTKEEFTLEKAHITLSVQKMTGVGPDAPAVPCSSSSQSPATQNKDIKGYSGQDNESENLKDADSLMNDSALYELNLIAKECFLEPRWIMSPAGGPNGEFEVQVIFDKIAAVGKGRKKLDAKRDAATKIIQQIRTNKDLTEKYNPKYKKGAPGTNSILEVPRTDRAKSLFESSIHPRAAQEIESNSLTWKASITEVDRKFSEYLDNVTEQNKLDEGMMDTLEEFFQMVSKNTHIITSNPKQVLIDAPKHLADYSTNCCLIPAGSFALDCMRRDKLCINAILVYDEVKRISEKEFLHLYQYSLSEYQKLLKTDSTVAFEIDVQVDSSEIGDHLVITCRSTMGILIMQIQLFNSTQAKDKENSLIAKYDPSIVHIKRIYDCFDQNEKLKTFRNLARLMRIWRAKNNLLLLRPEIIDAILTNIFLNNKADSTAGYIMNCLIIMTTDETFQASLNQCGASYTKLYKEIPSKQKWTISSKCSQSLEAIYKHNFKESSF